MKRSAWILVAGALVAWNGAAAQSPSGVQANASAEHKTAASANQSGAQASSSTAGSASAQAGQNSASISGGTELQAVLTRPVDAKTSKVGDNVTAKTTQAVKSDGQVIIPKGSQIVGHVTEARARIKGQSESALGIVFDKAILKSGQEVPLQVSIQALAVAQSVASASPGDSELSGSGMGSAGGAARSGGGVLGGAASTVTNTSANVGAAAAGAVDSTLSAAGSATGAASGAVSGASQGAVGGLNSAGQFTSHTQGVFGLPGLNLNAAGSNSTTGTLITSPSRNVHLDSGTRMLLAAQGSAQAGNQQ
ncbi:MAG TPA: hypothetical protein VOA41_00445 [Candidatus Dormibacteraeota bacterium]|nr:hypothetical protein [Candidatus Dormibacteraeota bacterium]